MSFQLIHAEEPSADQLFEAGFYAKAIPLYEMQLSDRQSRFRLAQAHAALGNYIPALNLLIQQTDHTIEELLLIGQIYNRIGLTEQTLEIFTYCLQQTNADKIRHLISLYFAKQELPQESAIKKLLSLKQKVNVADVLQYEIAYFLAQAHFQNHHFDQAVSYYNQALPPHHPERTEWYRDTLYGLAWSYLHQGQIAQAESLFQKLVDQQKDEAALLGLAECAWMRFKLYKEESAKNFIESQLESSVCLVNPEAKRKTLLLRAQIASTYAERNQLYERLTQDLPKESDLFARGWYLSGFNYLEEGQLRSKQGFNDEALSLFSKATAAFRQALTCREDASDEVLYLFALSLSKLTETTQNSTNIPMAIESLQQLLQRSPSGSFTDSARLLLGKLYFQKQDYSLAAPCFEALVHTAIADEGLFWAARCAEAQGKSETSRRMRRQLFEEYPQSPYAAEAYFTYYRFSDYVQSDRAAILHLEALPQKYPDSPFAIAAWYLIGLDLTRDRKSPEGRWLRKKNLTSAIEAFQKAESLFDKSQETLSSSERAYYLKLQHRATLERALANLAIAEEAQGAKRQIYSEYAIEVLQKLHGDDATEEHAFWLAQAYIKAGKDQEASAILNEMIENAQALKVSRGYFLSRVWYEKAMIAMRQGLFANALADLERSEDAAKGRILSTDQRLDLWLQQSHCYRELKEWDRAILALSQAINDDAVSGLRIKAMVLRAEIYELQGRRELARRQLDAASRKGGEWAKRAQEVLIKEYGYPDVLSTSR